jgi:hypothetical protein
MQTSIGLASHLVKASNSPNSEDSSSGPLRFDIIELWGKEDGWIIRDGRLIREMGG